MSVSDTRRRSELERALIAVVEAVGNQWVGNVVFRPASLERQEWLNTTWLELQDAALIDDKPSSLAEPKYQLTPRGWLVGLRMSGALAAQIADWV